jgi:hypothetical protein
MGLGIMARGRAAASHFVSEAGPCCGSYTVTDRIVAKQAVPSNTVNKLPR